MPYYAGIRQSDGIVESLKTTLDPSTAVSRYSTYEKIASPISNVIYDETSQSFREMTQTEIDATAITKEATRQAAKPLKLKQSENDFLTLIASVPVGVGIAPGYNSAAIKTKLQTYYAADKTTALEIALDLLNAIHEVELQGGSWYDLPSQLHNI